MEGRTALIVLLCSMVGTLIALIIFAVVAIAVGFPMLDTFIAHASETIINELNSTELTCGTIELPGSIPVTIENNTSYCTVRQRAAD